MIVLWSDKKINILNQEIEILKNEIKNFDLNRNEEAKIEIKDLQKSLLLVKEELKKILV